MKITCSREALQESFALASSVAPSRSPKEILRNVKLIARDDSLVLMATDMEIGIRVEMPVGSVLPIEREGEAVVPVARMRSILRDSDAAEMTIEATEQATKIKANRSRFNLASEPPNEFPNVSEFGSDKYHEIPARLFREMIRRTVFACDLENASRYALGGVLLDLVGDDVRTVGTDGRRLTRMEGKGESVGEHRTPDLQTMVPAKAIQLIERAIGDTDETVQVCAGLNEVYVRTSRASVNARLIEGRFPNWQQIVPDAREAHRVDIACNVFQSAIRQAAVVTEAESKGVEITFDEGLLRIEANTATVGDSSVEVPIAYDGAPVVIMLDHTYLIDFCRVLDPEKQLVLVFFEEANRPFVIETDDGSTYLIMPMRTI